MSDSGNKILICATPESQSAITIQLHNQPDHYDPINLPIGLPSGQYRFSLEPESSFDVQIGDTIEQTLKNFYEKLIEDGINAEWIEG